MLVLAVPPSQTAADAAVDPATLPPQSLLWFTFPGGVFSAFPRIIRRILC